MKTNKNKKDVSEIRQDIVKGEWVIIATARGKRPHAFFGEPATIKQSKSKCPFEDPFLEGTPISVYLKRGGKDEKDWSVIILPNKFPALSREGSLKLKKEGPYSVVRGVGFHELVIMRDHNKFIPDLSKNEAENMVSAYHKRYVELSKEKIVAYILILHNHGRAAGSSLRHLHSQIIAPPVVPIDVQRSIDSSKKYFQKYKKCVHCFMIQYEMKSKKRIIYQNKKFIAFIPFASRIAFEIRIFPKEHQSSFAQLKKEDMKLFADILQKSLGKLRNGLNDPAFNFFIHTTPTKGKHEHYHWHVAILPKTSTWAGYEIGSGMEISAVLPEEAAKFLRSVKF